MIKSFRLESDLVLLLSRTVQLSETTESKYVSVALRKQLTVEPLVQNFGRITFSETLFRNLLGQTNSDGLQILATEMAKESVPFALELLGLELTLSSLEWFMREVLQRCGWFKLETMNSEIDREFKLVHNYGQRWSLFLRSYFSSSFELVTREK